MNNKSCFIKNYLASLLSSGVPFILGIFTIPYLVHNLGLAKFGIYSIFLTFYAVLPLFDFGISKRLIQIVATSKSARIKKSSEALITALILAIFFSFCIAAFILLTFFLLRKFFSEFEIYFTTVFILALSVPFIIVGQIFKSFFEGMSRFDYSSIIQSIFSSAIYLGPLICLLHGFNTLNDLILGFIFFRILGLSVAIYLSLECFLNFKYSLQWRMIFSLLAYAKHVTFASATAPIFANAERICIARLQNKHVLGEFAAPSEFLSRIFSLVGLVANVLFPTYSRNSKNTKTNSYNFFKKTLLYVFVASLPLLIVPIIFSKYIGGYLFGYEFPINVSDMIVFLSFGYFFNGLAQLCMGYIYAHKLISYYSWIQFFELLVYIPSLLAMTHFYGSLGASIALSSRLIFDFFILFFLIYLSNRKIANKHLIKV